MFKASEIAPGIHWVGALEWDESYIHGFSMRNGSTNNAYLIVDEQVVLIDTCQDAFADQLIERIESVIDPARIDLIVSNHSEKDHAGSIDRVLELAPQAKVITSPKGHDILRTCLRRPFDCQVVKTGDAIRIGERTLSFVQTPFVHWPDNMVTYCDVERILFSNDAFGQFICTSKRFDDEMDEGMLLAEAKKYFANIVLPYAKQTSKALAALAGLDIGMIAPSHGAIWRSGVELILDRYAVWSALEPKDEAVVVYDSMYGATKRMAEVITEAFMSAGVTVRQFDLRIHDHSDIIVYVMDAKYLAVGSSTLNMTMQPDAGRFMCYLRGLAPKGRIGISFGSYGWATAAQDEIAEGLARAGYVLPLEPLCLDWDEHEEDAEGIFERVSSIIEK